jgi:hypothetical protein
MGAVTVRFNIVRRRFQLMYDISYITLMYDISYISWNRMFYFGLGGLTSRACHLANFCQNVLNLVSTDGKSCILSPSGRICRVSAKRRTYGSKKLMYDISYIKIEC